MSKYLASSSIIKQHEEQSKSWLSLVEWQTKNWSSSKRLLEDDDLTIYDWSPYDPPKTTEWDRNKSSLSELPLIRGGHTSKSQDTKQNIFIDKLDHSKIDWFKSQIYKVYIERSSPDPFSRY